MNVRHREQDRLVLGVGAEKVDLPILSLLDGR